MRKPRDVLAAEFLRRRRHEFFYGRQVPSLHDAVVAADASRTATAAVSSNARVRIARTPSPSTASDRRTPMRGAFRRGRSADTSNKWTCADLLTNSVGHIPYA